MPPPNACSATAVPLIEAGAPPWSEADRQAAIRCLSNRTLWVIGNSVARHWAFILAAMLSTNGSRHNAPKKMYRDGRDVERAKCGAGGAWGGQRVDGGHVHGRSCFGICECSFEVQDVLGSQARLVFGWVFDIASPQVERGMLHGVAGSPPPDIVVYNAGIVDAQCSQSNHPHCNAGLHAAQNGGGAALGAMVRRVHDARPRMHFYWRATTATCGMWRKHNNETKQMNTELEKHLCALSWVRTMDAFAWTIDRPCDDFDDAIHHSVLAFDHVVAFLRNECPRG